MTDTVDDKFEQIVELDENLDLAEELDDEPDTEDVTRYGVYFD